MSNLTLDQRLEELSKLDSTIIKNANSASEQITYIGTEEKLLVHRGHYDGHWIKKNKNLINRIITGTPLKIEMNRNRQSVHYAGERIVNNFDYHKGYIALVFEEEDFLLFSMPCPLGGKLIICGDEPQKLNLDPKVKLESGEIVPTNPDRALIHAEKPNNYFKKNTLYFEADGFLKLDFNKD